MRKENPRAKNLCISLPIDVDLAINVNSQFNIEYDMSGNLRVHVLAKAVIYTVSVYELSPSLLSLINIDRRKRR